MASTAPGARKKKLDYNVDGAIFDDVKNPLFLSTLENQNLDDSRCFMKACSRKGYASQVILEQAMKKFIQTGQV